MRFVIALLIVAPSFPAAAQSTATAGAPPAVFLDCQARACDSAHIRNEIRFVDWMRDRADADVYVLITSESTGGGG
ncbi:MAG: hypothetical protein ACREK1_09715, partial [Longimicrobiales bacterium]